MTSAAAQPTQALRVAVLGATGTIGRAVVRALLRRGHHVLCPVRPRAGIAGRLAPSDSAALLTGAELRYGEVTDATWLAGEAFRGARLDALVSCLASRTGAPHDAWAIDHRATVNGCRAAMAAGAGHIVLLSAICVQRPLLALQQAKLAAEQALVAAGAAYTIVRPTAFFKSLSGQFERVRRGRPFLLFGDGERTACKPISDDDLAEYIADCLSDPARRNRVLPIGGPGEALTPRAQGAALCAALGRPPRYRHVPVALLDAVIAALAAAGRVAPRLADKAELARIGRYYATESMLVYDPVHARYDAAATPSTGTQTLIDHYRALAGGAALPERGDHAVF